MGGERETGGEVKTSDKLSMEEDEKEDVREDCALEVKEIIEESGKGREEEGKIEFVGAQRGERGSERGGKEDELHDVIELGDKEELGGGEREEEREIALAASPLRKPRECDTAEIS